MKILKKIIGIAIILCLTFAIGTTAFAYEPHEGASITPRAEACGTLGCTGGIRTTFVNTVVGLISSRVCVHGSLINLDYEYKYTDNYISKCNKCSFSMPFTRVRSEWKCQK